jgi:hypothetical protein
MGHGGMKGNCRGAALFNSASRRIAAMPRGSAFVSVSLGRCPFAATQGTVHSLHGTPANIVVRQLRASGVHVGVKMLWP